MGFVFSVFGDFLREKSFREFRLKLKSIKKSHSIFTNKSCKNLVRLFDHFSFLTLEHCPFEKFLFKFYLWLGFPFFIKKV